MYDLTIIGGGPAGATLARLLGNKYNILLLEKRTFSEQMAFSSQKSCGGLLDPDAQKMLARFGLGIPKSALLSPQMFAVRTIDISNSIERYYQRHYINIDRNELDKWLGSIVPPSVTQLNGCVYKSFEEKEDGLIVRYHHMGKDCESKTRLLIGADGAFSMVRRQGCGEKPSPELYVSIQEWFEADGNQNYYGAVFDQEITDFYSWTIPKENQIILGTAIQSGRDALAKFELLKTKLRKYGYGFEKSVRKNGAYLVRPSNRNQICTGRDRIVLIGEAAGFISPSSAEGFSYAFRSSLALAEALEQGIEGCAKRYAENTKSLKRNILLKNLKSPAMYNPLLRKYIMKSGLLSIDVVKMRKG